MKILSNFILLALTIFTQALYLKDSDVAEEEEKVEYSE